jgi:2'-5' RNA ligase
MPGQSREEFFRGVDSTVKRKIINLIKNEPDAEYDILIDENGKKYIKKSSELVGQEINIIDNKTIAKFEEGNIIIEDVVSEGALPQQKTVDQLKKLRKITKSVDIGDKISDMNKQGANIQYIRNPINTGIESQQDFEKHNKSFQPGWNLKRIQSFKVFKKEKMMITYQKFIETKHRGSVYEYGCVMIYLDIPNWNEIISMIDPEDIYHPEDQTKGLETNPHVTILYGLHNTVTDSDVKSLVNQIDINKINLKIAGIGVFENKDFDVVKFNVDSRYLHQINSMFRKLPHTSEYPDYNPHITIAYVKPGSGKKYKQDSYEYQLPKIRNIVYSKTNGEKVIFDI